MKRSIQTLLFLIIPVHFCLGTTHYPSGDAEIDHAREAVKISPTTPENYQQRMLFLSLWLNIAQQRGADAHSLFDSDKAYYTAEQKLVYAKGETRKTLLNEICIAVDAYYRDMEEVFRKLNEEGPIYSPFKGDPSTFPKGGNMDADWPMFQKDKHNSGYTDAPGPKTGELAWKFQAKGSIHTTVTLDRGTVYFGSNGGELYALNETDGALLWETAVDPVEKRARKQFTVPLVVDGKLYVGAANKRLY